MKFKQERINTDVFVGVLNFKNVDGAKSINQKTYCFLNFDYKDINHFIKIHNELKNRNISIIIGYKEIKLLNDIKYNNNYINIYNEIYNSYITYQLIFDNNSIIILTNSCIGVKHKKADELTSLSDIKGWQSNYNGKFGYTIYPSIENEIFEHCRGLNINSTDINLIKLNKNSIG